LKKDKIILVTHEFPPQRGGAGVYCDELAHAARKLSIDLEIWAPKNSQTKDSSKIRLMPQRGSQDWRCSWSLYRFIKKNINSGSYLHIGDPGTLRAVIRFGWMLRKLPALIITIHGSELLRFTRFAPEKFLFKKWLRRSEKIHVLSKHNEENLRLLCPEISDRIRKIAGAPARNVIPRHNINSKNLSRSAGNLIILLSVGRIHPRKGQLELIEAINRLDRLIQEKFICRIVGPVIDSSYFKKLKTLASQSACKIIFAGELNDEELRAEYENSNLFALTSIPQKKSIEGFGFVYLEASAHGLPIIAHKTGGVEDAVIDGETGLLADPHQPRELTQKIATLINHSDLRKQMSEKGKAWANQHSWSKIARKLYLDKE
jgi:phosphatidylinositol alpha-1,6-mannosyltransferase